MTVLLSLPHPKMIIMVADSRKITRRTPVDFNLQPIGDSYTETGTMLKVFPVPGIGCATLWGDVTKVEKGFPEYLRLKRDDIQTVEDFRGLVETYLRDELKADQDGEDVGFHIGGFMPDGISKLFHVFWGLDRPYIEGQSPDYRSYFSSDALALYNGRNDFVEPIIKLLVALQEQVGISIFDDDPVQRIIVADFVTRYISQFTGDVGGDIHTVLITPQNKMLYFT
jgi:hypothetical protein